MVLIKILKKIRCYTVKRWGEVWTLWRYIAVNHYIKPEGMTNTVLYSLTHNTLVYKIRRDLTYHADLIVFYMHFV